ncbi:hypothetical protein EGW08_018632 [Elysia chlorotica]|uniref:Cadherin domain-containing protein n=1 Tax=Elysia chlorotica TaxID=188477 RepID=A0A433SWG5_ELYCH|nr:hypothetical protein EGW08_018632 [Elysia chlorotica]
MGMVEGQSNVPVIADISAINNRDLPETYPVGSILGKIEAYDPDGTPVKFFLEGAGGEYYSIDTDTGDVILKKELDFETDYEISTKVKVIDATGQMATADALLVVIDENDNVPEFSDDAIFEFIDEDEPAGFLVSLISVGDLDSENDIITVTCNRSSALFSDACDKFTLRQSGRSNKYWKGGLYLATQLDFEDRFSYAVLLTAYDGRYYENNEIHIEVGDINDSPPKFVAAGPSIIREEEPIGTVFQIVEAEDQDTDTINPIRYELTQGGDNFQIDAISGALSNFKRLDYDSVTFPKNKPFDLTIKVRELLPNATLGNDPLTTATITIKVTVLDINDNTPTFDKPSYTAFVEENIVSGSNVPGLQMAITDIDSGTFNSFELVTLSHTDVFQVIPRENSASASATLYVVNGRKIDYEAGPREYIVVIEARQNNVPNPTRTGTATVTIKVIDVNDVTPSFDQSSYVRSISELSPSGQQVIDLNAVDPEEGNFGEPGIRYRLYGNIPPHFAIDPRTGVVTVASCATPGQVPCIDFERKQKYTLTVSATDDVGGDNGRTRSVELIINIIDVNDVKPAIEGLYERYIQENERVTINPLRIDVTDPDTVGGPLSFRIVGDSSRLWQVETQTDASGAVYGNITAIRPILYTDAPDQTTGQFRFRIEVQDGPTFITEAEVIINVLDINNNAPEFSAREFVEQIPENTLGEVFVIRVTASDGDAPSTGNGVLDITVGTGGRGKFYAKGAFLQNNQYVADIYTTEGATFNYELQDRYDIQLIVRDQGTPMSKTGRGQLTVFITDINNRNPVIRPTFESVPVSENTPIDRSVHKISAVDADADSILRFSFEPTSATDGNGAQVTQDIYRNLFRMDPMTGEVFVNGSLDRDRTASITYNLLVQDIGANPVQSGRGILLIQIIEYNDQPPQFNLTHYEIVMPEELNINSFIQNLYCTDEDDKIESYSLTQESPRRPTFFSFYSTSGAMILESRVDYDPPNNIQKIELTAFCTDTGTPQLQASAKVTVTVININDNYPVFNERLYRTNIPEGSASGRLNVNIQASDIDSGDYGVLKYQLKSNNSPYERFFSINEDTAEISISSDAVFDREDNGFLGLEVEAYDSPLDASVRLRSTVPVYITIDDINDNCPEFLNRVYTGTVPESADGDTSIIDVIATDKDEGINAQIVYAIKPGSLNPPDLFSVGATNGRIIVLGRLRDLKGIYSFVITATDMGGNNSTGRACSTEVPVQIEIQESLNRAPEWIRPPQRDYVIYVLESQYEGMLVYSAKASDSNNGLSGVVDYYFLDGVNSNSRTDEFRINRVTGVIRAEVEFDREEQDTYFLTLVARDRGQPAASSETTLTVVILDVNDNEPVFPVKDGSVIPLMLPQSTQVEDGVSYNNQLLGRCNATDADSDHENNEIFYELLSAQDDVRAIITVDSRTCEIRLSGIVNYETHPTLEFDILAKNVKNDDSVIRYRNKREVNPSIQHVIVTVTDTNDNPPKFSSNNYFGFISSEDPYETTVLEVTATDADVGDNARISYSLKGASLGFQINPKVGTVYNIRSFVDVPESERVIELDVVATNAVSTPASAKATIFVISPSNVAKLKVNRPLTDVQPFSQQIVNTLESNDQIALAHIVRMRKHLNTDGREVETATDVYVAAVKKTPDNTYQIYPAGELVALINDDTEEKESYNAISITSVEESEEDGFTLKEDAVIAILIISILLIVLALVLFCIACYCIRMKDTKKKRKIRDARHAITHPVPEPVETSFNPVYDNSPKVQEPVYTTVQKVRPQASPIAPVVIAAPENLRPLASNPPTNLRPVEPQGPVPVIETEVLPTSLPQVHVQNEMAPRFQPEYEDRIETEVIDPPEVPPPPPEVVGDNTIEVVFDDSPSPSPVHSSEASGK